MQFAQIHVAGVQKGRSSILILFFLLILSLPAQAATYPIVEPDFISEIAEKAQGAEARYKEMIKKEKEKVMSLAGEKLAKAKKNRVYYVPADYTLEFDIPRVDGNGNVTGTLYPKGYTFNVGFYMLVSSGCSLKNIHSPLPVYILSSEIKEKFNLTETMSIISVDRTRRAFRVTVYCSSDCSN